MEKKPSQALFDLVILFIVLSCSQFRCNTKESRLSHITSFAALSTYTQIKAAKTTIL